MVFYIVAAPLNRGDEDQTEQQIRQQAIQAGARANGELYTIGVQNIF